MNNWLAERPGKGTGMVDSRVYTWKKRKLDYNTENLIGFDWQNQRVISTVYPFPEIKGRATINGFRDGRRDGAYQVRDKCFCSVRLCVAINRVGGKKEGFHLPDPVRNLRGLR